MISDKPWWGHLLTNPFLLANVVGFGAALVLLYTAAVEWPRQADRFNTHMTEMRDEIRVNRFAFERQLTTIQRLEQQQQAQLAVLQALQKSVYELYLELLRQRKLQLQKGGDPPPVPEPIS